MILGLNKVWSAFRRGDDIIYKEKSAVGKCIYFKFSKSKVRHTKE